MILHLLLLLLFSVFDYLALFDVFAVFWRVLFSVFDDFTVFISRLLLRFMLLILFLF